MSQHYVVVLAVADVVLAAVAVVLLSVALYRTSQETH
jgi:hypothetical protein